MRKIPKIAIMIVSLSMLASCSGSAPSEGVAAVDREHDRRSRCVLYTEQEGCAPNIYRFFANFEEYEGDRVYLEAFARHGPRGELHIYPSNDAACRPVFGGAILVNPKEKVPADLLKALWKDGVARVAVNGIPSLDRVPMMWGEIGTLEGGGISLIGDSFVYFHSPEKLRGQFGDMKEGVTMVPPVRCLERGQESK